MLVHNLDMSIDTVHTAEEDMQIVSEAVLAGRPIPAEVAQRVAERSAEFRRRMISQRGLQDIGTDLIRQARLTSH